MPEPTVIGRTYRMSNCHSNGGSPMPRWNGMIVECIGEDRYQPLVERPDLGVNPFTWSAKDSRTVFTPLNSLFDPTDVDSVVNFLLNN